MAPSATTTQSLSSSQKLKRPTPAHIQTNGIGPSTSSPSPSISSSRLPGNAKFATSSSISNGIGGGSSSARSAIRSRKDSQVQLAGRGQRNSSSGIRSATLAAEMAIPQVSGPQPYIKSDKYILKKYLGNPPSLVIHLHPTHFKFENHEGSFSYKSPMATLISHLRQRIIPHDMVSLFDMFNVKYYEGCMIVQVHDHKSTVATQGPARANIGSGKTALSSIHNSNAYLTPSPYVPYPTENQNTKARSSSDTSSDLPGKLKTAEQKDKENMPAPAVPDNQRGKLDGPPKQTKVRTIVLHPTPVSEHADLAIAALDHRSDNTAPRPDLSAGGPLSAAIPPTPSNAILPPTPHSSMAPPAKKLKKTKTELDPDSMHAAEATITFATTAPLYLEPAHSAGESAMVLEALTHPMHSAEPPLPKTRKRTVAEVEADEAAAAENERYMLVHDDRLASTAGAKGGAIAAESDGQAGGASFEPRFEKFKTLENIKARHDEMDKAKKARQAEEDRKAAQDRERERLQKEAEKREHDKLRQQNLMNNTAQRQQHDAARRALMVQQMNNSVAAGNVQNQVQHAHPAGNGNMHVGIQSQPQRLQQQLQQSSGPAVSSPIARNGTPMNHSSPPINNMSMPMQTANSSMAGSPPRSSSVVHQNQVPMNAGSQGMVAQRSQQSHAGTPRLPNSTPHMHNTPLMNRAISQTPRMSQASPPQGQMAQVPMQMNGGLPANLAGQQVMLQQQAIRQHQMQQAQQAQQANAGMVNGQPMTQAQQQQRAAIMMQAAAQQAAQQGNNMPNPNVVAQNYAQFAAANMQQRAQGMPSGGMPQNMGINQGMPHNMANMSMQQVHHMQQLHQMRQQQAQTQAQMHAAQQAQGQMGQGRVPLTPQQMMGIQIRNQAQMIFQTQLANLQVQYQGNVPPNVVADLKNQSHQQAMHAVMNNARKRQLMNQAQQQGMVHQNTMQQQQQQQQQMQQMQNMGMQNHGM